MSEQKSENSNSEKANSIWLAGLGAYGRAFDEARLLRAAHAYEQATEWHSRHPDI